MIVGTAGHIDHGKTALVRALTGIDADRLPEEKARGITLDLGFAYWPRPDGQIIGFIDVPGHEKLVHNMLAGATGIDLVLLVVAADDGIMPQTREHLAILDLLGLSHGIVALTKADLVDDDRLLEVAAEITAALAGTCLAGAEILPVSGVTGAGIGALAERLDDLCKATTRGVADRHTTGQDRPRHDGSSADQRKRPVDRKSEAAIGRACRSRAAQVVQSRSKRGDALAGHGRHRNDFGLAQTGARQRRRDFGNHLAPAHFIRQIRLGQRHKAAR